MYAMIIFAHIVLYDGVQFPYFYAFYLPNM